MAQAKEGFSLSTKMDFIDEDGRAMSDLTWNIYGFDNAEMDEVGRQLIASLLGQAAALAKAKAEK